MSNKKAVEVNDLSIIKNYVDQKLKSKTDAYITGGDLKLGLDLSGGKLVFDASKTLDDCWTGSVTLLTSSGGYSLWTGGRPDLFFRKSDGSDELICEYGAIIPWKKTILELPDDFGTITELNTTATGGSKYSSVNDFMQYMQRDAVAMVTDCEVNHYRIVDLKSEVNSLKNNTAKLVSDVDVRVQTLEESMNNVDGLYREYLEIKYVNGDDIVHVCCDFYTRSNTMSNDLREIIMYKCGDIDNEGTLPCHGIYLNGTGENYPLYLKATRLVNGVLNNVVLYAAPRAYVSEGDLTTIMLPTPESNPNIIVKHTIKKVSSVTW